MLNANCPHLYLKVNAKRFHNNDSKYDNIFYNCVAFAVQSIASKVLTFHVMTDFGMMRSRVPIYDLYKHEPTEDIPKDYLQLWSCFSENVSVCSYDFIKDTKCYVMLKNKKIYEGLYLFTVDWYNNSYSEEPTQYKAGHIIALETGHIVCQPNNRITWHNPAWCTEKPPCDWKDFKVDTDLINIENLGNKWASENSDTYYYSIDI